jgi:hypothetical protein
MAKTVAEILKETGWSEDDIKALDQTKMEGLTRVVSAANESQEKAELALRAQREEYDQRIAPALANWADKDTVLSTKLAAAEQFINKVKDSGYLPKEILDVIPTITSGSPSPRPAQGPDGKFVAGANVTPGSPGFVDVKKELANELGTAFSFAADTSWKYRSLFGKEMPDSPTALIREASQNRMSPADWAEKKYGFKTKEQEISAAAEKAKIDAAVKEAVTAKDREWAEKVGNNPNVRIPQESAFAEISKAQAEGKRADPLKMTAEQRKANTHANIQKEFAERSSMVQ